MGALGNLLVRRRLSVRGRGLVSRTGVIKFLVPRKRGVTVLLRLLASIFFLISSLGVGAWAQTPPPASTQPPPADEAPAPEVPAATTPEPALPPAQSGGTTLSTITVSGQRQPPKPTPAREAAPAAAPTPPSPYQTGAPNVAGGTPVVPQMASQMVISGADLNSRPVAQPAEILEAAPGLAVVQHSGDGKANQYYLRGYDLDHGTDLATFWDDVPINLPTNAHGQGYTDLNFVIPETVSGLEVRKGPYWADVGDFDNAGALNISLRDRVDHNIQSVTTGNFGYERLLNLGSIKLGDGSLLYAANSIPLTALGPLPRTCASSAAFFVTPRAPQRMAFLPPRWPMRIAGTPATRSRCAPSRRDRSVFLARSIPPMAATPIALCSQPGWRNPMIMDCGKRMPMSLNTP